MLQETISPAFKCLHNLQHKFTPKCLLTLDSQLESSVQTVLFCLRQHALTAPAKSDCSAAGSCTTKRCNFSRDGYINCWLWRIQPQDGIYGEPQSRGVRWKLLGVNIRKSKNHVSRLIYWTEAFFPQMLQLTWVRAWSNLYENKCSFFSPKYINRCTI